MKRVFPVLRRAAQVFAVLLAVSALSACDSAEERAEKHYQTGLALLEAGDLDRALIEFRNVFNLNGSHKGARLAYARIENERGNTESAYANYLRLVEQYPDNLEGRRALAEMALRAGEMEEVLRHGREAARLDPDDRLIQSINNAYDYFEAIKQRTPEPRDAAVVKATELVAADPALFSARQVLIDDRLRQEDWPAALREIDAAFAAVPEEEIPGSLYFTRLNMLRELGDVAAIEAQLEEMIAKFPEAPELKQLLVRLYLSQEKLDDAEAFLRDQVDIHAADTGPVEQLIGFFEAYRGHDAAIAELDRIIGQGGPNRPIFEAMRAKLRFNLGAQAEAIAALEAILDGAEPSEMIRQIEVDLARMRTQTGDQAGARALVDKVLSEDPSHVEAIKLKSLWLIEDDRTGEAIVLLREGLGQAPRDPEMLTIMARAHERNGNHELKGEMLALAVEASGSAPEESLRYVAHLSRTEEYTTAENVLIDALRLYPDNTDLLAALGQVYIGKQDWPRIDAVIAALTALDQPQATTVAQKLQATRLAAQNRTEDLTELLDSLTGDPQLGAGAEIALIRSFLARNDVAGALARLDTLLKENPGDTALRYIKGSALAIDGRIDEADAIYRDILAEEPGIEQVWLARYRLVAQHRGRDAAAAILDEGLARLPDAANLLWAKAGDLESQGEIDRAIEIYEALYAQDSNAPIIANNLASLLATHRDDPESLQRAFLVGKRLRGSNVPAFQDTYGWIAYRMGNHEEALRHLEPASRALPDDPAVQYHLAQTYLALGRNAEALERFRRAAELVGDTPGAAAPFLPEVEARIARLSQPSSAPEAPEPALSD